jgi:hypothetical protein
MPDNDQEQPKRPELDPEAIEMVNKAVASEREARGRRNIDEVAGMAALGPTAISPPGQLLNRRAHPALIPFAEIAAIVQTLEPLFRCGYGITRTDREAPAYPKLIRAALLEIQDRIPRAIAELDKLEAKKD